MGPDIIHSDEASAYYRPATDQIHMPQISTFHEASGYYGTLAHELTHWTGAEKRLDRIKKFQNREAYAFEELVAEIGNCMLCLHLGITPQFDQSAAYISSWLEALKNDKGLIFKAASEAQKAVDFILAAADAASIAEEDRAAA